MTIKKSKVVSRAEHDYSHNFMPRKEIKLLLSFEEIKELLTDEELLSSLQSTAWHFKFYVKQLVCMSIKNFIDKENITEEIKNKSIQELIELAEYSSWRPAKACVSMIQLEYFPNRISPLTLYQMFNGTDIYDDYVAQKAFELYKSRKD